jgi:hypothetical protein
MIQKKNLRKASGLSIILMLVCIAVGTSCTATQQSQTILDIAKVTGGLGKVSVTIKNIGDSTAEKITIMISVKGGILNKIDIEKICSGCEACGTTIEPNAIKTESTSESGIIIGFGPITITTSAEAENAEKVEKTYNGFVLGPFVIVTQ